MMEGESANEYISPQEIKTLSTNLNICSNKVCKLYKLTKYNLTHENDPNNLCRECKELYNKELYCLYCKQIYSDNTDDGKEWIMCDECERWVHTECADIDTKSNTALSYNCLRCRKVQIPQQSVSGRRPLSRNNNNGGKVPDRRKTQECNLNNFGFYWQLSPAELAEDVEKLRQFLK